ncbi:transglutaminase-like cysteine peptidase [Sulfurimonas sp.]|uniref:transglutaminase-like cysteine peptidase n=1 Tax=Sulfurimonas sp. TaxID=2022749 RepID=UPI0035643061
MKLLLIIFIAVNVYASSYPYFSSKEIDIIKNTSGNKAKNRVEDYIKTINYYKYLSKKEQLAKVNSYLNQLLSKTDSNNNKTTDYWETPKEFLKIGYGDCEDYAIIKYYTLLKLGFKKSRLYMTIVYDKFSKSYHMVLSYFETRGKPPLILDNLSFRILTLDKRDDLIVHKLINEDGTYTLDKNYCLLRVDETHPKLKSLLKKVKKDN